MGIDVWFLVRLFIYFNTLCVQTAKALASGLPLARLRRLALAFAVGICDKYHFTWACSFGDNLGTFHKNILLPTICFYGELKKIFPESNTHPICLSVSASSKGGERGGSVVECRTPQREVGGSIPTAAVLCPWARHFTPRKYWLITQEAVAPSRHDWKIVDWDFKPQHKTKQVAQRATIAHLSPMCQGQISFQKHINGPWKPEARNRTRPSFYACPGYQQLWWWFDQKWMS